MQDIILGQIVSEILSLLKSKLIKTINTEDFRKIYSKVQEKIQVSILDEYSNELFYNSLDQIITRTDILEKIIFNTYIVSKNKTNIENVVNDYLQSYKIDSNCHEDILKVLLNVYDDCWTQFNTQTNDSERRIINNIITYSLNNKEIMEIILKKINESHKDLSSSLKEAITLIKQNYSSTVLEDIEKIKTHSHIILERTKTDINGFSIDRESLIDNLKIDIETVDCILISGERGTGKSSIIKNFINENPDDFFFVLSADELSTTSIDSLFTSIGLKENLSVIKDELSLIPQKYLVIDSIEKILTSKGTNTLEDLLNFAKSKYGWKVIASVRDFAVSEIIDKFLTNISHKKIEIEDLKESEIKSLSDNIEILKPVFDNKELEYFTKNLFYISQIFNVINIKKIEPDKITKNNLEDILWNNLVRDDIHGSNGFPDKREKLFIAISLELATKMQYRISYDFSNDEFEIKNKLAEDNLIIVSKEDSKIYLPHDIWLDWSIYKHIDNIYKKTSSSMRDFYYELDNTAPLIKSIKYREWLIKKYKQNKIYDVDLFNIIKDENIKIEFIHETIRAILYSKIMFSFLNKFENEIFVYNYIYSFLDVLLLYNINEYLYFNDFKIPKIYEIYVTISIFLYKNIDSINEKYYDKVVEVIWILSNCFCIGENAIEEIELSKYFKPSGLIAIYILNKIKLKINIDNSILIKIYKTIINTSPLIKTEFIEFFNKEILSKDNNYKHYVDIFIKIAVQDELSSKCLAKYFPDELIKLSLSVLIEKLELDENPCRHISNIDFGTVYKFKPEYASAIVPPFSNLFTFHYEKALDFIIELCNIAVENNIFSSEKNSKEFNKSPILKNIKKIFNGIGNNITDIILDGSKINIVTLELNDGNEVKQISSKDLWFTYRGIDSHDELIASALMAFENWLIEYVKNSSSEDIEKVYNKVIKNSKSVLTTAVLASVATGFSHLVKKSAYPIIKEGYLYIFDCLRLANEFKVDHVYRWNIDRRYMEERKKSMELPFRKKCLKDLLLELQLLLSGNEIFDIVDSLKSKYKDDEYIYKLVDNHDLRKYKTANDGDNVIFYMNEKQLKHETPNIIETEYLGSITLKKIAESISDEDITKIINNINVYYNRKYSDDMDILVNLNLIETCYILLTNHSEKIKEYDFIFITNFVLNYINKYDNTNIYNKIFEALPILYKYSNDKENIEKIILFGLFNRKKNISRHTAIGIKKYLLEIDKNIAIKFSNIIIHSLENNYYNDLESVKEFFFKDNYTVDIDKIKFSKNNYDTILFSNYIIINMSNINHIDGFKCIEKNMHNIIDMPRDISMDIMDDEVIKIFAEYIFKLDEIEYQKYYIIFNEACIKQPDFIFNILIKLEEVCESNDDMNVFWNVYESIIDTMVSLTIDENNKRLLRHMVFADMQWQRQDLEKKYIRHGKKYVINFAKKRCYDINVFEGLCSLMYYFNNIFFEEGIRILANLYDDSIKNNLSIKRTTLFLEKSISSYFTLSNELLDREVYSSCLKILDMMIKNGSSTATSLKDKLLLSKKIR